jgi:hypothetical protein
MLVLYCSGCNEVYSMVFRPVSLFLAANVLLFSVAVFAPASEAQRGQSAPKAKADKGSKVAEWFQKYDQIRRQAQMSPQEKERSGKLLTQGMVGSIFKSAETEGDRQAADALLKKMVALYTKAEAEMDQLAQLPETKKLHQGYKQYFNDAGCLFSDYLKIQGNLFATDSNGNSIIGQLQQRKAALEALDVANKELDARTREKFNIAPYAY